MILYSDAEILDRINKPKAKEALDRGQRDNDRQRFHALLATDEKDAGPYVARLLEHVNAILPDVDKQKRFKELLRFPVPSAKIVDSAADEYQKVFTADDRLVDFELSNDKLRDDFKLYLDKSIGFEDFMRHKVFNQALRSVNAVWYCDLPAVANTDGYATPVVQVREYGQLTDIATDLQGKIALLIVPMPDLRNAQNEVIGKQWAVLDAGSFRVVTKPSNTNNATVTLTNPHSLGRCPAGFIWHHLLDENNPLRRESPIHASLDDLDQFVIGSVFARHADLYASFPILWQYKVKCDYLNKEGKPCTGGYTTLNDNQGKPYQEECPKCAKRKPLGPGSLFKVPPPATKEQGDLREPVGFVNADVTLLEYNQTKLRNLELGLKEALKGDQGLVDQTAQAVNEDQVQSRLEARRGILSYWAENCEVTESEILDCLGQLRYDTAYIGSTVSYGREYHLLSLAEAETDYSNAQKNGLPQYLLIEKRRKLEQLAGGASTKNRLRLEIMAQLEPYIDLLMSVLDRTTEEYELKANFAYYLSQFEREYVPIEQVALGGTMKQRIEFITPILYEYVSKTIAKRPDPAELAGGQQSGSSNARSGK